MALAWTITWADVVAIAGADFDRVEPAGRAGVLEHVNKALSRTVHSKERLRLRAAFLAAHLSSGMIPPLETDAVIADNGVPYAGAIKSEEVGRLKRSYGDSSGDSSSSTSTSDESLATTEWGRMYLALRPARARLPRMY